MKIQNPFLFFIIVATAIFLFRNETSETVIEPNISKEFKLTVHRGAFHYDRFEVTPNLIKYYPSEHSNHDNVKYNSVSEVKLSTETVTGFIKEIETRGFWKLKNEYKASSSCLSELKITLEIDGKSKTVICDDFERDCSELIKYIDKKVVELEGNDLKRIYLPG